MAANAKFRSVLAALTLNILAAGDIARATPQPGLDEVRERFRHDGAEATNRWLAQTGESDSVLDHIGRGEDRWIALSPQLATDNAAAATMEGLGIALASALPRNPRAVLSVIRRSDGLLSVQRVCGAPFIEPSRAFLRRHRRQALAAVVAVRNPSLRGVRSACVAELRKS